MVPVVILIIVQKQCERMEDYDIIIAAIKKLKEKHQAEHIAIYGADNDMRLVGEFETADINTFTYGVADRGAHLFVFHDLRRETKRVIWRIDALLVIWILI